MFNGLVPVVPTTLAIMALTFLPLMIVMGTAFTKISIVLLLVRNAMGVQQAPSGLVINSIALVLAAFIMAPVAVGITIKISELDPVLSEWQSAVDVYSIIENDYGDYLTRFSDKKELAFFMDAAKKMWPQELHEYVTEKNILILLPAHVVSEITKAFEIAFLLFMPFVIIDLIVSNILLAMGAMMVPPMLISLPIKILLFVAVDGWARLLHNLVLSYAQR